MENSSAIPLPYSAADAQRGLEQWTARGGQTGALPAAIFGNSPYLSRLLLLHPPLLQEMEGLGPDQVLAGLMGELSYAGDDSRELMRHLRLAKGKLALLAALADIAGVWTLEQVTAALSDFAEACLNESLGALLRFARRRGEIGQGEMKDSGIIVLGMGKLGGRELNYSSDIDLIIFFEPGRLGYKGRQNEQHFMNKLAHDLVSLMQERTSDGYVFRTDLRLRPDPASTPPAVTTEAAYYYYESVGQNWERAAMIKARPIAGDREAGERFLRAIAPFMWRRSLDFAAINDIHSIKRQMDSLSGKSIAIKGHNIKLGRGGIREIEFYAQIHQLIWGGRKPQLRTRATCETLGKLAEAGLIENQQEKLLRKAYGFLRKLEHRLQMVADEQTHSLPETDAGIAHIACFMGYTEAADFERDLLDYLNAVHAIYASSFQSAGRLGEQGNLVFTGVSHDPETLDTLRKMGYGQPETVSEIVMGWHHGSTRATRTQRARELLTEMMPLLLARLSETSQPDAAFRKFGEFLTHLPSGVQLFSLFAANPHLLGLIADIMGSAPTLADALSRSPDLLDAVLSADFYGPLPSRAELAQELNELAAAMPGFEERMECLRLFRNEKQFQAGVQMLRRMIDGRTAGAFLSLLADTVIKKTLEAADAEFSKTYGHIADSRFAVIALGKLGSREMTFSSDIDLVFIYDVEDFEALSDGEKSFTASVYFNRFAQRFLNALSAMGRSGRLYEVDTRLRPSGKQGLLAISFKALDHYFAELAWTFEYMAFTKARVIAGDPALAEKLELFIRRQLVKPRDPEKLRRDARDMRERIAHTHGDSDPWDIKYVRGGLMDIDFIAQYLVLRYAPETPAARPGPAHAIFQWLEAAFPAMAEEAKALREADYFLGQIFQMLRLCCDRSPDEAKMPQGLQKLLVESMGEKDFTALKARMIGVEESVHKAYIALLH